MRDYFIKCKRNIRIVKRKFYEEMREPTPTRERKKLAHSEEEPSLEEGVGSLQNGSVIFFVNTKPKPLKPSEMRVDQ
jgi:hypothetical protein